MKAVKFIKEYKRMCKCYSGKNGKMLTVGCSDECPIIKETNGDCFCSNFMRNNPKKAVRIVSKWSKEHKK